MRFGDRKDGKLLRDVDSMHVIMSNFYPRRTENEAYILDTVDLTEMNSYLNKKNKDCEFKYTMFQFVLAVMAKVLILRPKLNYFIVNKKMYERNYHSLAFTVKRKFEDKSEEGLAIIRFKKDWNFDLLHNAVQKEINVVKKDDSNKDNKNLNIVNTVPKFILKIIFPILRFLDKHGKLPKSIMNDDPNHASIFVANLGSIGLNAGYHHLNEWGTNSVFCIIGKKMKRPFFNDDGSYEMKDSLDFALVVDERIADGYYYAKSIKLAKYLFEHPYKLDEPFFNPVDYE